MLYVQVIAFAMLTFLHLPGLHILINQNATYQGMSALLQRLSRVNTYMLYTRDSLCNNVDISANAGIPYKPKRYLPRHVNIVAKAITCKHYTCCIHVVMLCNNVDISTFARIPYFDQPKR